MNGSKRAGFIGLGVCALVAALCVQIVCTVIVSVCYGVVQGVKAAQAGVSQADMMTDMMSGLGQITGIVMVVAGILLLFVYVPWFYFGCGRPKISRESARRTFAPRTLLVVVLIAAGLNYGINCLMLSINIAAPQALEKYNQLMETAGLGVSPWANAAAVILAPLGEELIFRGVVFYYARRAVSDMKNVRAAFWIANVFQALLFGVYHMNLVQGIYAFFIGLALGYLCERYRSVIPGMLAHLVFNGMSTLFDGALYAWIPEESLLWCSVIGVAAIALVVAIMALNGLPTAENEPNVA